MSTYPWHEAFYKILNQVTELISYHSQDELFRFLQASHTAKVPESGNILAGVYIFLAQLYVFLSLGAVCLQGRLSVGAVCPGGRLSVGAVCP